MAKKQIPLIVIAIVIFGFLGLLYMGLNPMEKLSSESQRWGFSIPERLMTQSRVIIFYISLILFPHPGRLNLDHDFSISHSLIDPATTLPSIAGILILFALAVYLAKKEHLLSFCILWFFGTLFIESSFITIEIIYEHRLYLPSMFFILAIVTLTWRLIQNIRVTLLTFSVLAILLCIATYQRNTVWADPVTLWADCAEKSPNKSRPQYNLACQLDTNGQHEEAIKYYQKTIFLDPNRYDAYEGIGNSYLSMKNNKQAIEYFNKAIEINPNAYRSYYLKGKALYEMEQPEQAIVNFLKSISINARYEKAYNALAIIYIQQGNVEKAMQNWKKALQENPEMTEVLNNLAWIMATSSEEKYRNSTESIRLSEKACEITKYENPEFLDTLAAAYASAGKFEKAIEIAQQAVDLLNLQGNNQLASEIKKRIELYINSQPYRDKLQ